MQNFKLCSNKSPAIFVYVTHPSLNTLRWIPQHCEAYQASSDALSLFPIILPSQKLCLGTEVRQKFIFINL